MAELAADCSDATRRYSQEVVAHGRDIQRLDAAEAQVTDLMKQVEVAEVRRREGVKRGRTSSCIHIKWRVTMSKMSLDHCLHQLFGP